MSRSRNKSPLPTREDIENLFETARQASKRQYQRHKFAYLSQALGKLFSNSLQWLHADVDPRTVLLETLQDERAILDQHNRLQAKALFEREEVDALSEEPVNFPLRHLCQNVKLPVDFFQPIYQVDDHTEVKKAAQRARSAAVVTTPSTTPPHNPGKLSDAPMPGLHFPDGNFTLAEIAAFLPQSIKCWDMIDRIIWNGATSNDLQKLINKYRTMPSGEIDINSVYMMMRGQMRRRTGAEHNYHQWSSWVVGDQDKVQKPDDFNPDSISVTGFRRVAVPKNRPYVSAEPILFRNLALGVSVFPEGEDALDLTRCVAWCVDHPEEDYYYPTDYLAVLNLAGGSVAPDAVHADGAVLTRLRSGTGRTHPRRRRTTANRNQNGSGLPRDNGDAQSRKRKRGNSSQAKLDSTARKSPRKPLRLSEATDSEGDTDDAAYQAPKRVKKNKDGPRRSTRTTRSVDYDEVDMDLVLGDDHLVGN
ncbi:hypothetical protein C7974DRAFT_454097 [Boeremia exigua]|uniref:uncharacterized protein n=1 Tax=Boeremia exigua TaxID=749465 RepID=UPI001E8E5D84|nr:uncharacterized protein C7974DRAFT_454097 [Boeremia exigua]KAH6629379.1 hypothetical protein C7974DRAFT_454097 [Boeremia exigua]